MEQVARSGHVINFEVDKGKVNRILEFKKELGEKFPRFGVFVLSYNAALHIEKTISRIPEELVDIIDEIFIFDDNSPDDTYLVAREALQNSPWKEKLNIYKNPRNLRYGGNQKVGYRYAINKGIDYIIMLHGDGQYAPEYIPDLILPTLEEKKEVVFASRMAPGTKPLKGGMPLYKYVGNKVLTKFENLILGTKLYEFHSGYRLYSKTVLEKIPFEENTDEFHFDTQIIVQCRALNVEIKEVPIKTFYGDEECNVDGFRYAFDVVKSVLAYRLHQLHIIRRGRYILNFGHVYTRKFGPNSSHELILKEVAGGKILGVGEHIHLMEDDLRKGGGELTIFSSIEKLKKSPPVREFDYLILADVLATVPDTEDFLRYVQKYLKAEGKLILSVPNIAIWFYRWSLFMGRFAYGERGILDRKHLRFFTHASISELVKKSGIEMVDLAATGLPFEVVFESVGKSKFIRFMDIAYGIFAKSWKRMFAYQFVITGKITRYLAEEGEGKL